MATIQYRRLRGEYAHPSFTLGEIIVAAIQAAGAIARRVHARHRQRRQAWATYDALRQLNDHTLRDLGFDRSELRSIAAEVTEEAERTRVRAIAPARRSGACLTERRVLVSPRPYTKASFHPHH